MVLEASYGFWSVVPSCVAILLAVTTRRVLASLLVGLWIGYLVLEAGDPWAATLSTIEGIVWVFAQPSNTYTILFTCFIGGLVALLEHSGGVFWLFRLYICSA